MKRVNNWRDKCRKKETKEKIAIKRVKKRRKINYAGIYRARKLGFKMSNVRLDR
jgi:hypothetical protein